MNVLRFLKDLLSPASSGYSLADERDAPEGWRESAVAQRQHAAYAPLMNDLRRGAPRLDLQIAAQAVRATGLQNPTLLEIGCGSGYYSEVLERLAEVKRYVGLDYSPAMIGIARREYAKGRFIVGDATTLPFVNASFDISLSGNSLMHISHYAKAIAETARVSRRWCIFHSIPVIRERPTTRLRKKAYGVDVVEIIFNAAELESLFHSASLVIRSVRESVPYDLSFILHENSRMLTYVCEKES